MLRFLPNGEWATAQSLSLPDIDSARKWIGVEGLNLFPSRYTANPRRPLLRVIPPTYKKQYPVAEYIILKNLSTRYLLFRYDLLRVLRRQTEQWKNREQETDNRYQYDQIESERWPMSCRCRQWNRKKNKERAQVSKEADNHLYDPSPIPNQNGSEDKDNTIKKEKDVP